MIRISPALPDDAKILTDIAMRSKQFWGYDATFMDNCRDELTQTSQHILSADRWTNAAKNGEQILGFSVIQTINKEKCELEALFVDPAHIGHGIGHLLMMASIATAAENMFSMMEIVSDPNATGFYQKYGAIHQGDVASQSIEGRRLPLLSITLGN